MLSRDVSGIAALIGVETSTWQFLNLSLPTSCLLGSTLHSQEGAEALLGHWFQHIPLALSPEHLVALDLFCAGMPKKACVHPVWSLRCCPTRHGAQKPADQCVFSNTVEKHCVHEALWNLLPVPNWIQ